MEQKIREYVIEGAANTALSCETALKAGRAAALLLQKDKNTPVVIVGADTRQSCDMLAGAFSSGLCSGGADVKYVKTVPTAAVPFLVNRFSADAGVMVTAENLPYKYNGIKMFNSDGFSLSVEDCLKINAGIAFTEESKWQSIGNIYYESTAIDAYVHYLLGTVHVYLDGLKIAVDCANGSASSTAKILFSSLCTESAILFNNPNGVNINKNCGTLNTAHLCEYVRANGLDVGISLNGDASACFMVDENGSVVDGDTLLAICALDYKERGLLEHNTVVGTSLSNLGLQNFFNEHHINFVETDGCICSAVQKMAEKGYVLGGEKCGKIVFGTKALTADGQLTALQILSLMKRKNKKLSELASAMRKMPQIDINVPVCDVVQKGLYTNAKIEEAIKEGKILLGKKGRLTVVESEDGQFVKVSVSGEAFGVISTLADDLAALIHQELT